MNIQNCLQFKELLAKKSSQSCMELHPLVLYKSTPKATDQKKKKGPTSSTIQAFNEVLSDMENSEELFL